MERTIRQLELHPELGSIRFASELDLPTCGRDCFIAAGTIWVPPGRIELPHMV